MNLLFDDVEVIESVGDPASVRVGGISHDSRAVVPGDLFCCVPGRVNDGHAHAAEAVQRGAVGVVCEHFIPELLGRPVVQSRVAPDTMRPVMARLCRGLLRPSVAGPRHDRRDGDQRKDDSDAAAR
jgi:UDP-N-acetylmuramyl pentapeptide synthase